MTSNDTSRQGNAACRVDSRWRWPAAAVMGLALATMGLSLAVMVGAPAAFAQDSSLDEICRNVAEYTESADVAYQPGVDAHGRAVAPADLSGSTSPLANKQEFSIGLESDPIAGASGSTALGSTVGRLSIGTITVTRAGKVYLDGEPVTGNKMDQIKAECAARGK